MKNLEFSYKIEALQMECIPMAVRKTIKVEYQDGHYVKEPHQYHVRQNIKNDSPVESQLKPSSQTKEGQEVTYIQQEYHELSSDLELRASDLELRASYDPATEELEGEMNYLNMEVMGTTFGSSSVNQDIEGSLSADVLADDLDMLEIGDDDVQYDLDIPVELLTDERHSVHDNIGDYDAPDSSHDTSHEYEEINNQEEYIKEQSTGSAFETSVFCHGDSKYDRICHFKNLCYSSLRDSFMFFHGNGSVLDIDQYKTNVNEFVQLSTAAGYNGHSLFIIDRPSSAFPTGNVSFVNETAVIFNRFKPDNFLHVMHDDIIPLHNTLDFLSVTKDNGGRYNVQLVFTEGWEPGQHMEMYTLFSAHTPITKQTMTHTEYTCFTSAYTALSKATMWYHYGYSTPQGAITNSTVTAGHIHHTVNYILGQLSTSQTDNIFMTDSILLLSRKENRRILNEMEIMLHVSREMRKKVVVLSFETHTLSQMISYVRQCNGIIAMHGALLSLAVFLKPSSFVIELFPYAVTAGRYTPFRTLAHIPGMGLVYKHWQNLNISNTKGHPNWPKEFGGIGHLSHVTQKDILTQTEVPEHTCCEDVSWLYHAYQDTHVNVTELCHVIHTAMQESRVMSVSTHVHMFPAPVTALTCETLTSGDVNEHVNVKVTWDTPININDLEYTSLVYEISAISGISESEQYFNVSQPNIHLVHLSRSEILKLWVRPFLDEGKKYGKYAFIQCTV